MGGRLGRTLLRAPAVHYGGQAQIARKERLSISDFGMSRRWRDPVRQAGRIAEWPDRRQPQMTTEGNTDRQDGQDSLGQAQLDGFDKASAKSIAIIGGMPDNETSKLRIE